MLGLPQAAPGGVRGWLFLARLSEARDAAGGQCGAFMSLTACTRDLTSGITTAVGSSLVTRASTGELVHYNWLGWAAVAASLLSLWIARRVQASETTPVPAMA